MKYFTKKYSAKIGKKIENIPAETVKNLQSYDWPGNVRELENVIERAAILTSGETLRLDELPSALPHHREEKQSHSDSLMETEKNHIIKILEESNWIIDGSRGAATKLGMPASTLRDRMKKLGIKRP